MLVADDQLKSEACFLLYTKINYNNVKILWEKSMETSNIKLGELQRDLMLLIN